MTNRSLGHRAPLLWLVLPMIAGLAFGKSSGITSNGWLLSGALSCALLTAFAALRAPRWWGLSVSIALILAGAASYSLHRARLPSRDELPPREAKLSLRVDRIFPQREGNRVTGLATVVQAESHLKELHGQRLYFSLGLRRNENAPVRSAVISTAGLLATLPAHPPTNTFDGYLAGAGMNFRLTRGRVLAEERPASAYYRFCARAAGRFREILGRGIEEKRPALTGLLRAMMLGEKHELSDEQRDLFMQSGTMHLFAISGLNIAVIAGAIHALLLLLRLPRWVRFVIGAALLWLFVDITGAAPSAVRAFGMAVFLQAALVLRWPANPLAALALSAFVVLIVAPLQVFSASFLMSYGIVTTLLVLGLPLGEVWAARWQPWRDLPSITWRWWQRWVAQGWQTLVTALAIGVATSLTGLLTGVQFFQLLTPGALIANLVLIPAAIIATLGGFSALVCGLIGFGPGAILCNHASALVLLIIEWLVRQSVKLPGAFLPAQFDAPWIGPLSFAALMALLLAGYAVGWTRARGGFWPPFILVALTLIFGVKFG